MKVKQNQQDIILFLNMTKTTIVEQKYILIQKQKKQKIEDIRKALDVLAKYNVKGVYLLENLNSLTKEKLYH